MVVGVGGSWGFQFRGLHRSFSFITSTCRDKYFDVCYFVTSTIMLYKIVNSSDNDS